MVVLFTYILPIYAVASDNDDETSTLTEIDLTCSKIDKPKSLDGIHRSPIIIPTVYYNSSTNAIILDSACHDCGLQLVHVESNSVVFSVHIVNEESEVILPMYLSGSYELRIIRGDYCFSGVIEIM